MLSQSQQKSDIRIQIIPFLPFSLCPKSHGEKGRCDRAGSELEQKPNACIPASIMTPTNHVTLGKSLNILNKIALFIKKWKKQNK